MSTPPSDFKKDLKHMLTQYLASLIKYKKGDTNVQEFEVRFKPHNKLFFDKTDYDKVVSRLKSCDFITKNAGGLNMLRIQNEYVNGDNGKRQLSNIRTELRGSDIIHEYCKNNEDLEKLIGMEKFIGSIGFTQKSPAKEDESKPFKKIENKDFKFNISFNLETDYKPNDGHVRKTIADWNDSKKTYRLINRVRFENESSPIAIDLSILRTSKTTGFVMIPELSIHKSDLFNNPEICEIELEVRNEMVGPGKPFESPDKIIDELQRVIKLVLSGLQSTKYPESYLKLDEVLESYMKLIHGKEHESRRVLTRDFIGPSSCTLQLKNVVDDPNSSEPNIQENYCATDKADGERKLLYINKEGRIYLIDTNMRVQFTGSKTDPKMFADSLIDGEHILYDKDGKYINLYAVFDIYFANIEPMRNRNFWINASDSDDDKKIKELLTKNKYRYSELQYFIKALVEENRVHSVVKGAPNDINIILKQFYFQTYNSTIFDECSKLIRKIDDGVFSYNTDGIIFTPVNTGVGGMESGQASKPEKFTWPLSFKWKEPKFNTIDFLVEYKSDKSGKELIQNKFVDGMNLAGSAVHQYRTIVLMCGFNRKYHKSANPFQDLLDSNYSKPSNEINNEETYIPVPFTPDSPYDPNASFADIDIDPASKKMKTEEGEVFEKDMIVEFSYDLPNKKWIPLRVRHDKTYDYRMGNKNYGNAYHVANDNWRSINNPIKKEVLLGIEEPVIIDEYVYYNRTHDKTNYTEGLRNFHNLYVKKRLIVGVSKQGDTLIDYAVGKGGDISKWKEAGLKFVFGVDVSEDNIYNQNDGVCARYLKERRTNRYLFDALFLPGNSKLLIREGTAFSKDNLKEISKAVFSNGKPNSNLARAVVKNHGIGHSGFSISSCQFAIHYFFENNTVLNNFLRNVSECTKIGGYFIGTSYDGETVFEKLKKQESYSIHVDEKMIFDIQKKYKQTGFSGDKTGIGYAIDVYQESINKYATEYLVHFEYLNQLMQDYGFVLISNVEAKSMGFPDGSGLFKDLFKQMEKEKDTKNYGKSSTMSEYEKEISFLNRYFIFKKTHNVDAKKVQKTLMSGLEEHVEVEVEPEKKKKEVKMVIRKLNKKVVLNKYEPVEEKSNSSDSEFMIDIDAIMNKK